jgi:RNase H-fold protein (predicted Holliday junction resolvase)
MAVDYGEKRVGLAISDELGMIASPAGFIARRAGKRAPIAEIIRRAEALDCRSEARGGRNREADDAPGALSR